MDQFLFKTFNRNSSSDHRKFYCSFIRKIVGFLNLCNVKFNIGGRAPHRPIYAACIYDCVLAGDMRCLRVYARLKPFLQNRLLLCLLYSSTNIFLLIAGAVAIVAVVALLLFLVYVPFSCSHSSCFFMCSIVMPLYILISRRRSEINT